MYKVCIYLINHCYTSLKCWAHLTRKKRFGAQLYDFFQKQNVILTYDTVLPHP
jgi:hypothetical protein